MQQNIRSNFDRLRIYEPQLWRLSSPSGEFAAAVRCYLIANGLRHLVLQDELKVRAMDPQEV